jgi:hypothetical protein
MTDYHLCRDDDNGIAFAMEANSTEDAIDRMKDRIHTLLPERHMGDWTLSRIERVEYPELNDRLDSIGPYHLIFVHQCSYEEDGTIIDDADLSFDAGTAGEVAFNKALREVDNSGTANE